ncbi:hypothetical protein SLS53_002418 [Cytospora paraplurivora]|uniref:Uncharacterized protein n=1 Tax=Cytospora paraplurivora TaxID=2898453 RepID=A0AAN9ULN2_9PEZI
MFPFRRDRHAPKARLKDSVSIFEGLIKPGFEQSSANHKVEPKTCLTGDGDLDGNHRKPSVWVPEKLLRLSRRNRSKKTLQAVRDEETSSNNQKSRLSKGPERDPRSEPHEDRDPSSQQADKEGIFKRISSKLRRKSASLHRHTRGAGSLTANNDPDEDNTRNPSLASRSAQQTCDATRRQENKTKAAESLRKRLKAELRPDMSADGLHQIPMTQNNHPEDPQSGGLTRHDKQRQIKGAKKMPTAGIQRVSTKWNNENPFQMSGDQTTKGGNGPKHMGHRLPHSSEESGSRSPYGSHDFCKVAFASVPGSRAVCPKSASRRKASRSGAVTEAADSEGAVSSRKEETGVDSGGDNGISLVVVANAGCELAHPRPSRSSERDITRVLCREEGEGGNDRDDCRKSEVSGDSSASYHTAPTGT